jgi:AmmeMemoRadiSam system protein A
MSGPVDGPRSGASDFSTPAGRRELWPLLRLAREAVDATVLGRALPSWSRDPRPPAWNEERGSFVTLSIQGDLRGCMGNVFPAGPLVRRVIHNARSAAAEDPRFPPVTPYELGQIHVELSVLTIPKPLPFPSPAALVGRLRSQPDGVVLQLGRFTATFLPQVWEKFPEPEEFLGRLAEKAGCHREAWREPEVLVMTYQVERFDEEIPG